MRIEEIRLQEPNLRLTVGPGHGTSLPGFQSTIDRLFPPLRVMPHDVPNFQVSLRSTASRDLQLTQISASPHSIERRPGVQRDSSSEYYKISLQLSGSVTMLQGNRETRLDPGMMTLYDTSRPYDLVANHEFSFLVAMFPKSALALPAGVAGELAALPLPLSYGVGALLETYLTSLNDDLKLLSLPVAHRLESTFFALLTLLLSETLDVSATDEMAQRRTTLLRILGFIEEHLADPELDPRRIATLHFISVRHLHSLFRLTGVGVAQWIKHRRLEAARRDLGDPLRGQESIRLTAERRGFEDNSYFSRVFKDAYGVTPGEWQRSQLDFRSQQASVHGIPTLLQSDAATFLPDETTV